MRPVSFGWHLTQRLRRCRARVTELEPNGEGIFIATLSPGCYGVFCLSPNPHHETSHMRRGMAMMLTVEQHVAEC
jgi:hypothetical protein